MAQEQKMEKEDLPVNFRAVTPVESVKIHISSEVSALKEKQQTIDKQIVEKQKELASLKDSFLVVSGALQALEHMSTFVSNQEKSVSPPS